MLTLVLTLAMLLSVMVVGAGAATFGDQESITNDEAVDMCVALNIIGGYEDGTFRPAGNVTRAEMCKMICVALNGGKEPTMGSGLIGTFNDVATSDWSAPYIEYCVSQGIVGGVGGGRFNPTGNITGTQAAKMLLCILGYDAAIQGYIGNDFWETKINVDAAQKGLYDELANIDASAALTRDQAAQMIWNALQANEVEYVTTLVPGPNGTLTSQVDVKDRWDSGLNKKITLLNDKYNATVTDPGVLENVSYNAVKDNYTNTISGVTGTVVTSQDYSDLIGLTVVGVKNNNSGKNDYGICVDDGSIIATAYATDITALDLGKDTIKMDGTTYDLDDGDNFVWRLYNVTGTTPVKVLSDINTGSQVAYLVDNDGDGEVDAVVLKPFTVGKISYVGNSSFSFTSGGTTDSVDKDKVVLYDGAAKDDVAVKTAAAQTTGNKDVYEKVEYVSATISGERKNNGEWLIDGTWYTNVSGTTVNLNDKVEYVAFGDVIYVAKVVENATGVENLAMIYRAGTKDATGTSGDSVEIKLITSDGTKSTGILAKINEKDVTTVDGAVTSSTNYVGQTVASVTAEDLIGEIVYFEINSDNEYEVKTLPEAAYSEKEILGYDGTEGKATSFVGTSDKFGTNEVADDAVIFYLKGTAHDSDATTNDAKIYTGKQLKNTGNGTISYTSTFANSLYEKVNGFTYTMVGALGHSTDWMGITTGANYGYLTADAFHTKDGSDTYTNYTIWTKDGSITVKEKKNQILADFPAGTVVSYDTKDDGVVENVTNMNLVPSYVTGYDGDKKVTIAGATTSSKIGDDTVILYVNTEKTEGVSGGTIAIADEPANGKFINNVCYIEGGNEFALIVVDVNNDYEYDGNVTLPNSATVDEINQALTSADVTLDSSTDVTGVTVPDGKTMTVPNGAKTVNTTVNGNVVVTGDPGSGSSFNVGSTGTVTLSGTTTTIPTITGNGNVVVDATVAGTFDAATGGFGGIDVNASTAATSTNPGTVSRGLELSGSGKITSFSGSKTFNELANLTGSTTVTPCKLSLDGVKAALGDNGGTLTSVMTLKDGKPPVAGIFSGDTTSTTITTANLDYPDGDKTGMYMFATMGDNVKSVTYTIKALGGANDGQVTTWTFNIANS